LCSSKRQETPLLRNGLQSSSARYCREQPSQRSSSSSRTLRNSSSTTRLRVQALAQQAAIRSLPVNEISALLSGRSGGWCRSSKATSGVSVAPAPMRFQAGTAQDAAAMQRYGIQANQAASNMGGLFNLSWVALAAQRCYLDRRLKSNIERIGTHPLGIGIYEYDIFEAAQRGVMADEVEAVRPEAVITRDDGYKMVNYGML
jgi:hypothetical protein